MKRAKIDIKTYRRDGGLKKSGKRLARRLARRRTNKIQEARA